MRTKANRFLSMFLAGAMVLSSPAAAFAENWSAVKKQQINKLQS